MLDRCRNRQHSRQSCEATNRTSYEAGPGRRVSTTSRSRSQTLDLVNDELVQRHITLLSGETCRDGMRAVAAPMSKACLKTRNGLAKADSGAAGVSRGRSTDPRTPIETGRTERLEFEDRYNDLG